MYSTNTKPPQKRSNQPTVGLRSSNVNLNPCLFNTFLLSATGSYGVFDTRRLTRWLRRAPLDRHSVQLVDGVLDDFGIRFGAACELSAAWGAVVRMRYFEHGGDWRWWGCVVVWEGGDAAADLGDAGGFCEELLGVLLH